MYSLLLVDDEKLELETLRDYVDWESMGFDRVYSARGGREAYDKVQKFKPDVMITDIHMPVMNGIDLARQMKEDECGTKVVFLTGFDEFEYARAALQVSAVDFILKPFSAEKIEEAMRRVISLIHREELLEMSVRVLRNKLLYRIMESDGEAGEKLCQQYTEAHGDEGTRFGLVMVCEDVEEEAAEYVVNNLSEVVYAVRGVKENTFFLVRYFVDFEEAANRICRMLEGLEVKASAIYVGQVVPVEELHRQVKRMAELSEMLFYIPVGNVRKAEWLERVLESDEWEMFRGQSEKNRMEHERTLEAIETVFHRERSDRHIRELEEYLGTYFKRLWEKPRKRSYVMSEVDYMLSELERFWRTQNVVDTDARGKCREAMYRIRYLENIETLMRVDCLGALRELSMRQETEDRYSYVVKQVKRYINEHYSEALSVDQIADEIGLSPNYMRSVFKEKTGITLNDWITEFRMKKACELLENRKLKVKDICHLVGYENSSYFGAVFAKRFGMTPNEYRTGKRS